MDGQIAVLGYGAVGRALVPLLGAAGRPVTVVQRRAPPVLPAGVAFRAADVAVAEGARAAVAGAAQVVCAVGVPYSGRAFLDLWPRIARNLCDACAASGARLLFADSLYMYGPQTAPLHEEMPLTDVGQKPRARAMATRIWQAAVAAGRLRAASVRASDFYGPDAPTSVVSQFGIRALVAGRGALAPYPADQPHAFTFLPDFARALALLLAAPDADWGRAWHVPNAPAESLRAVLARAAALAGRPLRLTVLPDPLRRLLGLFRRDLAELGEMRFQWDRPYLVDHRRFAARFGDIATPLAAGVAATVDHYRRQPGGSGGAAVG
jgi:nucleoside-diphosphate-sugar epimerase